MPFLPSAFISSLILRSYNSLYLSFSPQQYLNEASSGSLVLNNRHEILQGFNCNSINVRFKEHV